ncbi:MAG: domain, Band 7 family protein [Bacilli bacterium]|nr:domain, Band 7 family protein [Bacilli bacterium]
MQSLIVLVIVILVVILFVSKSIKIIPQQRVAIVERFGKYHTSLQAGINIIIPFIDRVARVLDLRTMQVDVPSQMVITRDNVQIRIDTIFFYTIMDPKLATYGIQNFVSGVQNITAANIRQVVGKMELDETLSAREKISIDLRVALDEATEKWGIRIERVEVIDINPPSEIQQAMEKQMRAEREKRANILQAEGEKAAAILRAEGEKQSAILNAEAQKEANIRIAEGKKQSQELEAQGRSAAIRLVAEAERARIEAVQNGGLDSKFLAYKSFEALAEMANGQATTVFVPTEAVNVFSDVGALAKLAGQLNT